MIRLKKGPKPNILVDKEAEWAREYKDALGPPKKMTDTIEFRYRHPEIKDALRREAHNKCIYCEGPVGVGETDHFKPVSKHPDLVVAWDNLGLVCKECNGHKSDFESPTADLVNPYEDKPEDHFIFQLAMVLPIPGDARGRVTYLAVKLGRMELVQRRAMRIDALTDLAHTWHTEPDAAVKKLLWKRLLAQAADHTEYAAAVRSYLCEITGETWARLKP